MGKIQTMTTRGFRLRSLQRSQIAFISKLQCANRVKRRGSKRTLQGTVSSTMKVTVSCLLTNLILPQGPCSALTGPVCQWLWVHLLKTSCFHFTYVVWANPTPSLLVLQASSLFLILPLSCVFTFPNPFKCFLVSQAFVTFPLSLSILVLNHSQNHRPLPIHPSL